MDWRNDSSSRAPALKMAPSSNSPQKEENNPLKKENINIRNSNNREEK
jgi:hypothetical protein